LNLKELKQLVKQGESDRLEFKKTTGQRTAAAKTVCAMLNSMGGFVIFGGSVNLAMYDDYLEIISPGKLHFGLDTVKLLKPHESRLWNPIIAEVFYRTGIIEKWGMGTLKILDWCREGHCPQPQWKEPGR